MNDSAIAANDESAFASDSERLASFARQIDAIFSDIADELGEPDVAYIRKVRKRSRRLEVAGRGLLFASMEPLSFGCGVVLLWLHKQLEATEIGHTVLHGTFDRLAGADEFRSQTFRWRFPVDEASWRTAHNIRHHQYTNVAGKDPDLRYAFVRLSARVMHRGYHRLQPLSGLFTWLFFGLSIQAHSTGLLDLYFHRDAGSTPPDRATVHRAFFGKVLRYYGREFALFPLLAGPGLPKVLLGNLLSEVLRDIYTGATIYCGHVGVDDYAADTRAQNRGQWYAMQVEGAQDFTVPRALSILCGGLDHQIEHHLFPRLSPERLRQVAPRVRAACKAHGVHYRNASWPATLGRTLRTLRSLAHATEDERVPA